MTTLDTISAGEAVLPQVDLNRERREERLAVLRRSRRHLATAAALASLAVAALVPLTIQALSLHRQASGAERQSADMRQRLQAVAASGGQREARITRWTKLVQTRQARRGWSVTLPALAACLPDDVSLQQVQVVQRGRDAQMALQGSAGTMAGLRSFTTALARSSLFTHLHLDETTTNPAAGGSGLSFQMSGPVSGVPLSP